MLTFEINFTISTFILFVYGLITSKSVVWRHKQFFYVKILLKQLPVNTDNRNFCFRLYIPLLPKAKEVLEKYNNELPRISNQKFNAYLKEIGVVIGIQKKRLHHHARSTFSTTVLLFNDVPM